MQIIFSCKHLPKPGVAGSGVPGMDVTVTVIEDEAIAGLLTRQTIAMPSFSITCTFPGVMVNISVYG